MSSPLVAQIRPPQVWPCLKISDGHDDLRCGLHSLDLARTGTLLCQWSLDNSVEERAFVGSPLLAKNQFPCCPKQFFLLAIGVLTYKMNLCSLVELLQLTTKETIMINITIAGV